MRRTALIATGALLGSLAVTGTASAGHDDVPSEKVASYSYELDAVQPAGVPNADATGETRIKALPNGKLQVQVVADGLAPNLPHAMHLHGVVDGGDEGCPGPEAAGGDGVVTTVDGAPFYGGILASLVQKPADPFDPDNALDLTVFAVADDDGRLRYERTFDAGGTDALAEAGTVQVVVHGIDFDGNGAYAFDETHPFSSRASSLDDGLPLEATVPVLCGGIAN